MSRRSLPGRAAALRGEIGVIAGVVGRGVLNLLLPRINAQNESDFCLSARRPGYAKSIGVVASLARKAACPAGENNDIAALRASPSSLYRENGARNREGHYRHIVAASSMKWPTLPRTS